jgi:hypothetical protein
MITMPEIEVSCQERELTLCKTLDSKGRCLENQSFAFNKNFKTCR